MAIKLSGLISGLDTDAMIDELVSAYSTKKDNIYREQKSLSYKQDAWKTLNSKIYSLFSGKLSNLRFSTNYTKKATSVSNSSKVSVTASNTAVDGTQELKILQLAKSGYLTGAKLSGNYTADTKMSEFGVSGSTRINVTVNGEDSFIDVTDDMTITQFTTKLKEAGLNASFDATNQRFFISSKESGAEADFSLSGNNADGTELLKKMGLYSVSTADISAYSDYIAAAEADSEYITNLAKNEYLNALLSNRKSDIENANIELNNQISENNTKIKTYKEDIEFAKSSDSKKTETLEKLSKQIEEKNEKIAAKQEAIDNETDADKKAALEKEKEALAKEVEDLEEKKAKYESIQSRVGSSEDEGFDAAVEAYETEINESISTVEEENKGLQETIDANKEAITTIGETMKKEIADKEAYIGSVDYASSEYTSAVDRYNEKLDNARAMVADYERYEELVALGDSVSADELSELSSLKTKLGLETDSYSAIRIAGKDAIINLNGAEFTSTSNTFQVNGLTITANAVTEEDEIISITTSNDVDGIYNMVKDFLKEYNELIKECETLYNAESAKDYKPLTEEEENEMSDKQVEKWEKKLTDAALRKDATLSSVVSIMKTAMSQGFEVDGETLTLSSFGIKTLGYFVAGKNEKGMYHIDGDKDDQAVSGNEDKLRAAIANDPEKFVSFFSQLTSHLYSQLNSKMSSSSLSSAYTVYNDKYMTKQYTQYKSELSDWEKKIEKMREKYEKQFSAMEKALSTLNDQQSQLSSLLGNG